MCPPLMWSLLIECIDDGLGLGEAIIWLLLFIE